MVRAVYQAAALAPIIYHKPAGAHWQEPASKAHGRVEQRAIHVLPAEALSVECRDAWQSIRQIDKVERIRHIKKKGKWAAETETAWLITSLPAQQVSPETLLFTTVNTGALKIIYNGIRM
jgi:hypothetical protein